jgi:hypothetical protein
MSDVALARSALDLVDSDPQLRDANLVVSVVDRVAVIGGPVPDVELGRRAESLVRQVPGIAAVKNRCFVQVGPGSLIRAMAEPLPPYPHRPFLTDLPGVLPGTGWARSDEGALGAGDETFAVAPPGERAVVVRRPSNQADNVLLGPLGARPGGDDRLPRPFAPVPPAVLASIPQAAAPVLATQRSRDPRAAAELIRRADPRFAEVRLDFPGKTIVISGSIRRSSDAWDLAEMLRDVPGVDRVAIGTVKLR